MFRGWFSRDAPKTLIFDALLRGKACFLMTRQKGADLLQKDKFSQRIFRSISLVNMVATGNFENQSIS